VGVVTLDRRIKPAPWNFDPGQVDLAWRWVWALKPKLALPLWRSAGDLAQRRWPTTNSITYTPSEYGIAGDFAAARDLIFGLPPGVANPLNRFTVIVRFYPRTGTAATRIFDFGGPAPGDPAAGLWWDPTNTRVQFVRNQVANSAIGTAPANKWITAGMRMTAAGANGGQGWINDRQVVTWAPAAGAAGTGSIGIGNTRTGTEDLDGLVAVVWFFDCALSNSQLSSLMLDPFGPFRPARRLALRAPAAGATIAAPFGRSRLTPPWSRPGRRFGFYE